MTNARRHQGLVFGVCTAATVFATILLPRLDRATELITVAVPVVLLGVPHGAMDALIARRLYQTDTAARWIAFACAYLAAAVAVVGVWVLAPTIFLAGFLLVSAVHFSADLRPGTLAVSRVLYGGAIIVLPAFSHANEVAGLFGLLAGPQAAAWITPVLKSLALPWLATLLVLAAFEARRDVVTGIELAAIGALSAASPPLIAFGVFFCVMHSARHLLRVAAYASDLRPGALLAVAMGPMAFVLGASTACWFVMGTVPVDARIMQLLFVGLAALTVPHMLLVERAHLSGWAVA